MEAVGQGIRSAQTGLAVNIVLVGIKFVAGVVGNTYALVADAVESSVDVLSSIIVWGGLRISARPADPRHPFGHGKAEALAAAAVSFMLLAAAVGIGAVAIRMIRTPHPGPALFTLPVAAGIIVIKEWLFRATHRVGRALDSAAVQADAWHHRSDALSSGAAFVGIALALWGGSGWEVADDYAALVAAAVIAASGLRMLFMAVDDLMDRAPDAALLGRIGEAACRVDGVQAIEKLKARKAGLGYLVDLHVQADHRLTLQEAHDLGHQVKRAIRAAEPVVQDVLVHMEPFEP